MKDTLDKVSPYIELRDELLKILLQYRSMTMDYHPLEYGGKSEEIKIVM